MELGKSIILSAPSGAGKTTIVHELIKRIERLRFSVSACSRDPRPNEINGKDYYFLGIEGFKKGIASDDFIEWEEVYTNNFYGTLKSEIQRIWEDGNVVIFDVDVIGGLNLKKQFGDQALAIFVQPPSFEILKQRLTDRSTETPEKIKMRLDKADQELKRANEFDYVLINDDLDKACNEAEQLVQTFIEA